MRIISGTARGKKLLPVQGMNTRPTTDRVKESVFNIIQTHILDAKVLDLFAGTGQLGAECLSRGAGHCDFIEHDAGALSIVQKNVKACAVESRAGFHRSTAQDFLAKCTPKSYDIIFLDPPYGGAILAEMLKLIERFDILSTNGIIICESAVADSVDFRSFATRAYRYGMVKITICKHDS